MFSGLRENDDENQNQNYGGFMPGYTGHCPNLKFHYGKGDGSRTHDISKDTSSEKLNEEIMMKREKSRSENCETRKLDPVEREGQQEDSGPDYKTRAPRYISGYTGFIPTLNSRYGKSYSRAADDSIYGNTTNEERLVFASEDEVDRVFRSGSKDDLYVINDEVEQSPNN